MQASTQSQQEGSQRLQRKVELLEREVAFWKGEFERQQTQLDEERAEKAALERRVRELEASQTPPRKEAAGNDRIANPLVGGNVYQPASPENTLRQSRAAEVELPPAFPLSQESPEEEGAEASRASLRGTIDGRGPPLSQAVTPNNFEARPLHNRSNEYAPSQTVLINAGSLSQGPQRQPHRNDLASPPLRRRLFEPESEPPRPAFSDAEIAECAKRVLKPGGRTEIRFQDLKESVEKELGIDLGARSYVLMEVVEAVAQPVYVRKSSEGNPGGGNGGIAGTPNGQGRMAADGLQRRLENVGVNENRSPSRGVFKDNEDQILTQRIQPSEAHPERKVGNASPPVTFQSAFGGTPPQQSTSFGAWQTPPQSRSPATWPSERSTPASQTSPGFQAGGQGAFAERKKTSTSLKRPREGPESGPPVCHCGRACVEVQEAGFMGQPSKNVLKCATAQCSFEHVTPVAVQPNLPQSEAPLCKCGLRARRANVLKATSQYFGRDFYGCPDWREPKHCNFWQLA